jgi:hypothetical protein
MARHWLFDPFVMLLTGATWGVLYSSLYDADVFPTTSLFLQALGSIAVATITVGTIFVAVYLLDLGFRKAVRYYLEKAREEPQPDLETEDVEKAVEFAAKTIRDGFDITVKVR